MQEADSNHYAFHQSAHYHMVGRLRGCCSLTMGAQSRIFYFFSKLVLENLRVLEHTFTQLCEGTNFLILSYVLSQECLVSHSLSLLRKISLTTLGWISRNQVSAQLRFTDEQDTVSSCFFLKNKKIHLVSDLFVSLIEWKLC